MVLIAATSLGATGFNVASADSGVKDIRVTAEYWRFTPSGIAVERGEKVKLIITVVNNMMPMMKEQFPKHGFYIDGYEVNVVLPVGDKVAVEFMANKEGTFQFFCTIYCGMGHDQMRGTLVVGKSAESRSSPPTQPGGMMPGGMMMSMMNMSNLMQGMGGMMGMMRMPDVSEMMGVVMPWGGWGWGPGFFWTLLSFALGALIALVAIVGYSILRRPTGDTIQKATSSRALKILQERFARGEISKKEFEEMKRTLSE